MDSSVEGAGFGCCDATEEELQSEARYAETRGWTATLEELVFSGLPAEEVQEKHRRDGFEQGNADKIFESTTVVGAGGGGGKIN